MKKLEKLKQERDVLISTGWNLQERKERRKLAKDVAFLNPLIAYLESDPTEDSLKRQLKLANRRLDSLIRECDFELGGNALKKTKTEWLNKGGAKTLRKQIKNLEFLLH